MWRRMNLAPALSSSSVMATARTTTAGATSARLASRRMADRGGAKEFLHSPLVSAQRKERIRLDLKSRRAGEKRLASAR